MYKDRLDLFRGLTVDELEHQINSKVFEKLLDSQYDHFVNLWEYIKEHRDVVDKVSLFYDEKDEIHFKILFQNTEEKII